MQETDILCPAVATREQGLREHFEKRTHSRLLDIKNLTAQTIDELMQLDLPAGVDVEVKL